MPNEDFEECDAIAEFITKTIEAGERDGPTPSLLRTIVELRKTLHLTMVKVCGSQNDALDCERYDALFDRALALERKEQSSRAPKVFDYTLQDTLWSQDEESIGGFPPLSPEMEAVCIHSIQEALQLDPDTVSIVLQIDSDPLNACNGVRELYKQFCRERMKNSKLDRAHFPQGFIEHLETKILVATKHAQEPEESTKSHLRSISFIHPGMGRGVARNIQFRKGKKR